MQKKRCNAAHRAWNILRLALLWARKGGVFKRRLMMDLSLIPKYLKSLKNTTTSRDSIYYGERELSFGDTPIFHIKMHCPAPLRFRMPRIPCINPDVDFDYDFDFERDNNDEGRKSFLKGRYDDEEEEEEDYSCEVCEEMIPCEEEEGIDAKAEEFIAKFYKQMKLQRQISHLEYNEMLSRGAS